MKFDILTLFPEMFDALDYGIVGRAKKNQLISIGLWNPRNFTHNKNGRVDDSPYGGGPGMVMQVQPIRDTLKTIPRSQKSKIIYLSPQGKLLTQSLLNTIIKNFDHLVLICGRYEGIDERIIENDIDEEWSIGNYILSGGELAAMVVVEILTRLLPDALGHPDSAKQDSFNNDNNNDNNSPLLDYPHYTKPECIDGQTVPPVLLSGNHQAILAWRKEQAYLKTKSKRPDLFTLG